MSNANLPATQQSGPLAAYDYGSEAKGAGFENVTNDDLSIPFLSILQSNSPEIAGELSARLKGAAPGLLLNSVTNALYDPAKGVIFQPVATNHVFVEWKPRTQGGGFVGVHDQHSQIVTDAKAASKDFGKYKTPAGNDLVETVYVMGLIHETDDINAQTEAGPGQPIIVTFQSTKIRPYRNLMYRLYTLAGKPPLFAHRVRISTVLEKNSKGTFYNFALTGAVGDDLQASLIPPTLDGQPHPLLVAGKALHKSFTSGIVNVNYAKSTDKAKDGGTGDDEIPF